MSSATHRFRFSYLLFLGFALILVLQFSGDPAHAATPQATTISVHMSNPSCVQAQPATGTCSLQFNNINASGSDTSFSRVELLVNGKLRFYMAGFFETSANFTDRMIPGGMKVPCGRPNAAGNANFGNSYVVTANAYMADGTSASNSLNVFCPAYDGKTFLPLTRR